MGIEWTTPVRRLRAGALSIAIGAFLFAAAIAGATKGLWFDEIFSVYEARLSGPVGSLIWEHWLRDGHPIWFNMVNWSLHPFTGDDIYAKRALNISGLLLAGGAFFQIGRRLPSAKPFLFVFALLMISAPDTLEQIIEHRINFAQLAAMTVIVAGLGAIDVENADFQRGEWSLGLIMGAAVIVALNSHYIGAFSAGLIVGIFMIREYLVGRRRWAGLLLAALVVGTVPLVASIAIQQALLSEYMHAFWNRTSVSAAAVIIAGTIAAQLYANPVIAFAGLSAMADRQGSKRPRTRPGISFAMTCLLSATAVFIILVIAHAFRPVLIARYLLTEVPVLLAAIAMLATPRVSVSPRWIVAATIGALLSIGLSARAQAGKANWEEGARIVAATTGACRTSVVHTPLYWNRAWIDDGVDFRAVMIYGYGVVARKYGFAVEPPSSTVVSKTCPTIIWVEHMPGIEPPSPTEAARGLAIPATSVARARVIPTTSGFVAIFPPTPPGSVPLNGTAAR